MRSVSPAMRRFRVGAAVCTVMSLCSSATSPYLADGLRVVVAVMAVVAAVVAWWQWRDDRRSLASDA